MIIAGKLPMLRATTPAMNTCCRCFLPQVPAGSSRSSTAASPWAHWGWISTASPKPYAHCVTAIKSPALSGAFLFSEVSIFAITTQFQRLATDAGVFQLTQQTIKTFFRQLDQAEALTHLNAADVFTGQTTFVEDRTQQVLSGNPVTRTQGGAATRAAFGQRHRCTALAAAFTIRTLTALAAFTRSAATATRNQRLITLNFSQGQGLAIGGLAQQGGGQSTWAATDIGRQAIQQITVTGFGIGHQWRQAVGQLLDACVQYLLSVRQLHLTHFLPGYTLNHLQHAALTWRYQQQGATGTTRTTSTADTVHVRQIGR